MHCKLSDAELLTTALVAARFFHGNLHTARDYMRHHHGVRMIDKSGFTRRRLLEGERYRGRINSKRRYFYGFKVQVITTEGGLPVQFHIHAGSFADITAFKALPADLLPGSELYADSGIPLRTAGPFSGM